jgi:hypothetical protein
MTALPPPLSSGLWGVLATPFTGSSCAVDTDSLRREVQLYTGLGAAGMVVLGVFGEGAALSSDEQELTVRWWWDCQPAAPHRPWSRRPSPAVRQATTWHR